MRGDFPRSDWVNVSRLRQGFPGRSAPPSNDSMLTRGRKTRLGGGTKKKKTPTRVLILLFVILLLQPRPLLSFVGVVVLFSCRTTLLCLFVYISLQYYYIPATKSTATPVLLIAAPHHHR